MDINGRLLRQVDPHALRLWNEIASGSNEAIHELHPILQEDFPSFCGLALKVRPKGGGWLQPFVFNQLQNRLWRIMVELISAGLPMWLILLKFRQAGMSTFWCAWLFWQMWRQKDIQEMVVAHQLMTAETMIETQRVFYDELPDFFKPELREGNHGASIPRGEIYFKDRRSWQMIHLAKNVDPRGQQVTHVLETEMAMYPNPDELNGALMPQLPSSGEALLRSSFVIESTPKGQNAFYDYYMDAKRGKKGHFKAVFFPWFLFDEQYASALPSGFKLTGEEKDEHKRLSQMRVNDYPVEDGGGVEVTLEQMYWRRQIIEATYADNPEMFDQEYPSDEESCWLLSSKSIFKDYSRALLGMCDRSRKEAARAWTSANLDGKPITANGPLRVKLLPRVTREEIFTPIDPQIEFAIHAHGAWTVWEPPVVGDKYCIGGDPSMGVGADGSCACVINVTRRRQVAEFWSDRCSVEDFAIEMAAAGYWYNLALLNPEINSVGFTLLTRLLKNIAYPIVYRWPKWDEVNRYTHKRGFETNNRTKQLMVSTAMHYFEHEIVEIASRDLVAELSTFEQKSEDGGQYIVFGAQKGRHDDRVMAFFLALMAIEQTPVLHLEINRGRGALPSARELHLATSGADLPPTPLPKQIEQMINMTVKMPWNPLGSEFV